MTMNDTERRGLLKAYFFETGTNLLAKRVLLKTSNGMTIALTLAKQLAKDLGGDVVETLRDLGLMAAETAVQKLTERGGRLIADAIHDLLAPKGR